jgi:hypothetical protein
MFILPNSPYFAFARMQRVEGWMNTPGQSDRIIRNRRLQTLVYSACTVAFVLSAQFTDVAPASALTNKQAMKECKKRYGKSVSSWHRNKKGKIICVTGGSKDSFDALPHGEKVEYCRKKYKHLGPITLRRRHGKWVCTYSN